MSEASDKKMLEELGYAWHPTTVGGEVRNSANDTITSLTAAEIRAWCNGVRHGLSKLTSCIHLPVSAKDAEAHARHTKEIASCPWCIVVRKERELASAYKLIRRLETRGLGGTDRTIDEALKGKKRG